MEPPEPHEAPATSPTVGAVLRAAVDRLRSAGSPTPRLDAEILLGFVIGRDRAWLIAHPEAVLDDDGTFDSLVGRRAAGEPIAYLRGFKEWRSLRLRTDARALIPRPETELLVDAAIDEIAERLTADDRRLVAWEVGVGSGAIAVSLALRFRQALALGRLRLIGSDRSPDALELASENLAAHGVESLVELACADLLAPAGRSLPRPDIVVANLPYVPTDEVRAAGGSLAHEPSAALDGGPDGLDVLRRLTVDLSARTAPGATVLLEIGAGQGAAVRAMAPSAARTDVERDLAGHERLVRIRLAHSSAA
jgi:release factor glutamine methyltransferase